MSPQVFAVTETWLSSSVYNNEILPNGYILYRRDRDSRGGGILICVDSGLPSKLISTHPKAEILVVEVGCAPAITLCLVYKSPNASDELVSDIYTVIEGLATVSNLIVLGDFNCPDIDWQTLSASSVSSTILCDLLFEHNLGQLVSSPTHVHGNVLDLVITNSESCFTNLWVDNSDMPSDHFKVCFTFLSDEPSTSRRSKFSFVYDYTKVDFSSMCSYLCDYDFSDFLQSSNVDELWFQLKSLLKESVDKFVPLVRVSNGNTPKWFTQEIRHLINKLRFKRRKNLSNYSSVRQAGIEDDERVLRLKINMARSNWERNLVDEFAGNSNHKIFNHIGSLTRDMSLPQLMVYGTKEATDDLDKAELFNEFFHSVQSKPSVTQPGVARCLSIDDLKIDPADTFQVLSSLDTNKAMGIDGISPRVLKFCACAIYEPLTHLFQLCIDQGYLPQEWKLHVITPIFKSGDRSMIRNYRPISLLCIVSKVLEN